MERTIDRDGLSFTKPDYLVKYLMDNAEVYAALGCMESLLERYPVPDGKRILTRLRQRRTSLNERLEALLWNQGERRYETGADAKGKTLAFGGWQEFYPDATAQLFPILFGLLEPASQRAQEIYRRFCREHAWQEMEHYATGNASFYWGLVAYAGAKMGDEERVYQYMAVSYTHLDVYKRQGRAQPICRASIAGGCPFPKGNGYFCGGLLLPLHPSRGWGKRKNPVGDWGFQRQAVCPLVYPLL